jgi:5-amino-6-(D-ribitylamino)uracil---L-tyrosine 4-hydroxyphenyl transferase
MEHSLKRIPKHVYSILDKLLDRVLVKQLSSDLSVADATILLSAKESPSVNAIAAAADACRAVAPCKDNVSYVVNRNINFTNACVMRCGFCAFSRTGIDEEAYFLPLEEIVRRAVEAANLGATEICIQVLAFEHGSIFLTDGMNNRPLCRFASSA